MLRKTGDRCCIDGDCDCGGDGNGGGEHGEDAAAPDRCGVGVVVADDGEMMCSVHRGRKSYGA